MPRRPALGTIAINSYHNQKTTASVGASLKTSIRTTTTTTSSVSDENAVSSIKSNKQPFDYDIYTDESSESMRMKSVQFVDEVEDVELKTEPSESMSSSNKENQKEKSSGRFMIESDEDDDDDDDDTCNDQEEFDDTDDEISEFGDEDEQVTSSSVSLESSEEDDDQIVTLDSIQQPNCSIASINLTMSPMACDDTIKLLSTLNEDEEEEEDDKENRVVDEYERKMRQAENVLFNLIDYKDDCLEYMRHLELELRPDPGYMKKQVDISSDMRAILVDWLVDVAEEYKLKPETLFLSVNYLDRFLSKMGVPRNKLQLLGITCMYIASKCEELMPPEIKEFVYITDDTYSSKQLIRLEQQILPTLGYRVNQPTVNWFLDFYLKSISLHTGLSERRDQFDQIKYMAHYLAELTLIKSDTYLNYLPSQIAASALYLSLHTFGKSWTRQIADLVNYELTDQLKMCIVDVLKTYQEAYMSGDHYNAINTRYRSADMLQVSLIAPLISLPFYTSK